LVGVLVSFVAALVGVLVGLRGSRAGLVTSNARLHGEATGATRQDPRFVSVAALVWPTEAVNQTVFAPVPVTRR
jgi:hypothetical protein